MNPLPDLTRDGESPSLFKVREEPIRGFDIPQN